MISLFIQKREQVGSRAGRIESRVGRIGMSE
jgi:hypothetical protein